MYSAALDICTTTLLIMIAWMWIRDSKTQDEDSPIWNYVVLIEEPENEKDAYGLEVPALDGCYPASDKMENIAHNAEEAIILHLWDDMASTGKLKPPPKITTKYLQKVCGHELFSVVAINVDSIKSPDKFET